MKRKRWHAMNFRIPKLSTLISFLGLLLFGSLCVTYHLVTRLELDTMRLHESRTNNKEINNGLRRAKSPFWFHGSNNNPPTTNTQPPIRSASSDAEDFRSRDNGIIQIVHSRFMQNQHNLTHLGMARLEIFKSFCFPTMVHQTNQHFLWIIKTDPLLNSTIQKQMIELLTPYPNFILIGSNRNEDGFRRLTQEDDIFNATKLLSGDLSLVQTAHTMSQNRVVLETRLDADDGLNIHFVNEIQMDAYKMFNISVSSGKYSRQRVIQMLTSRWYVSVYVVVICTFI